MSGARTPPETEISFVVEKVSDTEVAIRRLDDGNEAGRFVFRAEGAIKELWQPLFLLRGVHTRSEAPSGRPSRRYFPLLTLILAERALGSPGEDSWCEIDALRRIGATRSLKQAAVTAAEGLKSARDERLVHYRSGAGHPGSKSRPMATLRKGIRVRFNPELLASGEERPPEALAREWLCQNASWLHLDAEGPTDRRTNPRTKQTVGEMVTAIRDANAIPAVDVNPGSEKIEQSDGQAPDGMQTSQMNSYVKREAVVVAQGGTLSNTPLPTDQALAIATQRRLEAIDRELDDLEANRQWNDALRCLLIKADVLANPRFRAEVFAKAGEVYTDRLGEEALALEAFAKAIDLDPLNPSAFDHLLWRHIKSGSDDNFRALIEGARTEAFRLPSAERLAEIARIVSERSATHSVSAGVWADVLRLNPLHSEAASEYLRLNGTRDRTERGRDLISFIEDFKNDREQRLRSLVAPAGVVAALAETAQILTECCINFRNPQEDETDLFFQTWQAAVSPHETVDKDRVLALNIAIDACEAIGQRKLFHPIVWECVERLVLSAHSWAGKDTLMSLWFGVRRLSKHHKDWGLYPGLADKLAKVGYCGEVDSEGLAFASLKDDTNFCLDVIEGFVRAGDNARAIEYLSDLREVKKVKGSELQWIDQVLDACREKGAYDVWEVALRCRLTEFHNERELSYWSELAALYEQHLAQPLLAFASYVVVLTRSPHNTEALEACKRLSPAPPAELGADCHESVQAILALLHLQDPKTPLDTVRFLLSHGKIKDAIGVIVSTCDVTPSETGFEVAIHLWQLACSLGLPPFGMKELDYPTVRAARTITKFDEGSVENEDEFMEALRAVLSIGHESENGEPSPCSLQHSQQDTPTILLASARERSSFRAKLSEFFTEPDSVSLTMSFVSSLERVIGKVSAVCFLVWVLDNLVFQSLHGRANEDDAPSHFGDRPVSEESTVIHRELTRVTCARIREVAASLAAPITGVHLLSLCLELVHSDGTKRFLRQFVASARSAESE